MSWTAVSDATDPSWTAPGSIDSLAWAQLSTVTDSTGGVDFVLKARTQYPLKAVSDRPLKALTSTFSRIP